MLMFCIFFVVWSDNSSTLVEIIRVTDDDDDIQTVK